MHEMMVTGRDTSGHAIWECMLCPRKFVITSYDPFMRVMAEEGDVNVRHFGTTDSVPLRFHVDDPQ